MNDDFDELDRALFALPLETPPPGMRDAILRSTIGAGAHAPAKTSPFGTWDIVGLGTALAVCVWLLLLLFWDKAFDAMLTVNAVALVHGFVEPSTLLWLAAGGAVAAWVSLGSSLVLARNRS
ncbi:MAG: hypothetical protein GIW94_06260 [Candidatus Eremiobacteraeota bacterium]|nr:hypothetical protein [Candidatus Eremiobacteraeota bacterium]MBC5823114.1 hypothetical protein [Candidatus Eremiobacteraeota bacterium]